MVYPETIKAIGLLDWNDYPTAKAFEYKPGPFRDFDVDVEIECCGVCGGDVFAASGQWMRPYLPIAFGHEIVGRVVKVGSAAASRLQVGDRVGVGAQVDCDETCRACMAGLEQHCRRGVMTYLGTNWRYDHGERVNTMGGTASHVRVNSKFVVKVPEGLPSETAAVLMCGGVTGAAPLMEAKVGPGTDVAIVGLGGIGSMALQFAKAMGARCVTVVSRTLEKQKEAFQLGADKFLLIEELEGKGVSENEEMTMDVLLYTGSSISQTVFDKLMKLIKPKGKFRFICPGTELKIVPSDMLHNGVSVQGSVTGSLDQINAVLEFADEHNIRPWIETVDINEQTVGQTWKGTQDGKVRFRYVLTGYDKYFNQKNWLHSGK